MAERPVFVPTDRGPRLVEAVPVKFSWHPGLAPSQKAKNVASLHEAAKNHGLSPLLEISSKSNDEIGRRLSAFILKIQVGYTETTVESAYQGSKVFTNGGPFTDLYMKDSRTSKKDERLRSFGQLVGFEFEGKAFPLTPATAFYDWLYLNALYPHRDWLLRARAWAGFTDIEFNPDRSLSCQARSFATFISLQRHGVLDDAMTSFDNFESFLRRSSI